MSEHRVTLQTITRFTGAGAFQWVAMCSCGWRSPEHTSATGAREAADNHVPSGDSTTSGREEALG